ncbi:MAG: phospholipase D-like domain-containing protein [Anaerolineae bacterium]
MNITATFLYDVEHGGPADQPQRIAMQLAEFIRSAQSSLHLAIYDFRLDPAKPAYGPIVTALKERAAAGVAVQIAYDHGKANAGEAGVDPAPIGTAAFLTRAFAGAGVECRSITDRNPQHPAPRLMHDKYIIRDGEMPNAAIWTGSVNLTDDSLTFQDSNLIQIASSELARYYETDFQELWTTGDIESSGANDAGTVTIGSDKVQVAFSPGEGGLISTEVTGLLAGARRRIKIASMLLASRPILQMLARVQQANQVAEFAGVYDATQMEQTLQNWQTVPHNQDLLPLFEQVSRGLARKHSDRYAPTSKHNFMHNKVVVVDDVVFTGSYNLSHSATENAENALLIYNADLAEQYSQYIDRLIARYR